jgi:preprotein translocase subunit SecF
MRGFAISVVTVLVLALFVFKTGNSHDFCLGIAVGLMVGLLAQSFAISKVELKDTPGRSDVDTISFVP